MKKFMWAALMALALSACFKGGAWPEELSPSPNGAGRMIKDALIISSSFNWQRTGWYRSTDMEPGPVYVVVAQDNSACITTAPVWALAKSGDFMTCKTPWRIWRP